MKKYVKELDIVIELAKRLPTSFSFVSLLFFTTSLLLALITGVLPKEIDIVFSTSLLLVVSYLIFIFVCRCFDKAVTPYRAGYAKSNSPVESHDKLHETEIERHAVHEAGHLIAVAIFPRRPDRINAWINKSASAQAGGTVKYEYKNSFEGSLEHLRIRRLFAVLPMKAEEIVYGELKTGAISDLENWELDAKLCFNNFQIIGSWYRNPSTSFEVAINAKTLNKMLIDDLNDAQRIVEKNIELIADIRDALIINSSLSSDQIDVFLDRVVIPDNLLKTQ